MEVRMPEVQKSFFVDEEVASEVLAIVREAEKYVVVVTPYLDLWGHAQDAFRLAVKKGTKVTVILRHDPEKLKGDDVGWLVSNGIKVQAREYLHAKIYLNEHSVLVSSMNLTEFSEVDPKIRTGG
jgi:phosphatidylserine/phosphatidylglycerophosphate/cardiolipin synthase-like enzyme